MNDFSKNYKVQPSDIDQLKHVSNIKYVEWIQEISKEHWYAAIDGKISESVYLWVIANHNITYLRPAFLNEELLIRTYVKKFERKFSYRIVEIHNAKTKKLVMKSETKWCLVNPTDFKTLNVTDEIKNCFV
jgi:acyl-CoA thioester hydrolase